MTFSVCVCVGETDGHDSVGCRRKGGEEGKKEGQQEGQQDCYTCRKEDQEGDVEES